MTTVTGLTATRMLAIEAASVVSGVVTGDNLILTKHDATTINAGNVRGDTGPVGSLVMFAGAAAPTGWLICDGAAVSRSTYSALYAVIGTGFGVGNGTTTFNVPDMRGRAPIGVGTGSGLTARALAAAVGEETHLLTGGESGTSVHNHTQNSHAHTLPARPDDATVTGNWYTDSVQTTAAVQSNTTDGTVATNNATTAANAASAHNNMQPSVAVNFIIKI